MEGLYFNSGVRVSKKLQVEYTLQTPTQKWKSKYYKKGVVSCKSMQNLIWLNSWTSCSEIFHNIVLGKFLRKYVWWRPLLCRCTTGSLERYWRQTLSQIFPSEFFEITQNSYPTSATIVISCLLTCHFHCLAVRHQYKW